MKDTVKIIGLAVTVAVILSIPACSRNNAAVAVADTATVVETTVTAERTVTDEDIATVVEATVTAVSYDFSKILQGDLSGFPGYWENGGGSRVRLKTDGTFNEGETSGGFSLRDDGTYSWGVGYEDGMGGYAVNLIPPGIEPDWAVRLQTDTAKVRMVMGHDAPSSHSQVFYFYPGAPGEGASAKVYYAAANLRLRSEPDTSQDNRIATVPEGGSVELLEVGNTENIDGINAPWYRVRTIDGIGWVFSGYLTETDFAKVLKGDFSDFAGKDWENGLGETKQIRADGSFGDGDIPGGFEHRNGAYLWGIGYEGGGGYAACIFPVGVEAWGFTDTDTTRVRLFTGQDTYNAFSQIYYLGGAPSDIKAAAKQ